MTRSQKTFLAFLFSLLILLAFAFAQVMTLPDVDAPLPTLVSLADTGSFEQAVDEPETITIANSVRESADGTSNTEVLSESDARPVPQAIEIPEQDNRYIVAFSDDVSLDEKLERLQVSGVEVQSIAQSGAVVVIIPDSETVTLVNSVAGVTVVEPDYFVMALTNLPTSDPYFSAQYSLDMMNIGSLWQALPADTPTMVVAVIDSGICLDHPDLQGRILEGYDYIENDTVPQDERGHGCAVSGIIAANSNNTIGIAGIAPHVNILPLRVLDAQGIGRYSNVADAIYYAVEQNVDIINLSLGGTNHSTVLQNAVDYAASQGVLVIAASGNSGGATPLYPAYYVSTLAVGSLNQAGEVSTFSNRGADIYAPGEGILSLTTTNGVNSFTGTSFAAPNAAGYAALMLAMNDSVSWDGWLDNTTGGDDNGTTATPPVEEETVTVTPTPDPTSVPENDGDSLEGWLNILYGDPPSDSDITPITVYTLTNDAGELIAYLEVTPSLAREFNHQRVRVSGQLTGEALTLSTTNFVVESIELLEASAEEFLAGSQPYVNILCKFADNPTETHPRNWYANLFSTSYPGLDHYWQRMSYGNINLSGTFTVAQWYTLPHPRSYYVNDALSSPYRANLSLLAQDCANVADADVHFPTYKGINFFFNGLLDCCAWGGGMYLNLDGQGRSYPATWLPTWAHNHSIIAHEMGHAFGLPHSSGPANNPPTELSIYISSWDVMSNAGGTCSVAMSAFGGCLGQGTIAYHRDINSWIPQNRITTVHPGDQQTVTLESLELPPANSNPLMVRVPINGSNIRYYTVEARNLTGYDLNIPGKAVIIHHVDVNRVGNAGHALVVDATDNNNVNDAGAMWLPGETFLDIANNIGIQVISQGTSSFTVRVTNGLTIGDNNIFYIPDGDVQGLIQAIEMLNATGPGTIELAENGHYGLESVYDTTHMMGLPRILEQITINGNGSSITRVGAWDVSNAFGTFKVAGSLTLNDVSVMSGYIPSAAGGNIWVEASGNVALQNVSMTGYAGWGGNIYNQGTLSINQSSFYFGAAGYSGGAIYAGNNSQTTINNSFFYGNGARYGGAIYVATNASVTANNLSMMQNNAYQSGGAIYVDTGGTLKLDNSSLMNNYAYNYNDLTHGGAISNWHGNVEINNVTFQNNRADYGGVIHNNSGVSALAFDLSEAETAQIAFMQASAIANQPIPDDDNGQAIPLNFGSIDDFPLHNPEILPRPDKYPEGAIIPDDSAVQALSGAGIFITNSTFNTNEANYGGAIYTYAGSINISNSLIQNNQAWGGSGIYNWGGRVDVTTSRLLENHPRTNNYSQSYFDEGAFRSHHEMSITNSCIVGNQGVAVVNAGTSTRVATNNWWGASTGAGGAVSYTSGGDRVSRYLNTSNHYTSPIMDCGYNPSTATNTISGRVSFADDTSVSYAGIHIEALAWDVEYTNSTCADANGRYSFTGVPYDVEVVISAVGWDIGCGKTAQFLTTYHDNSANTWNANSITLSPATPNVNNADIEVIENAYIIIQLYDMDTDQGIPYHGVYMMSFDTFWSTSLCTDDSGLVSLSVPANSFISYQAYNNQWCGGEGSYIDQWNSIDPLMPDSFTFHSMGLEKAGRIFGTVLDIYGNPRDNISLRAYSDSYGSQWGYTDQDGFYQVKGIPFNTPFTVEAQGYNYNSVWWEDSPTIDSATTLQLTTLEPARGGINFIVEPIIKDSQAPVVSYISPQAGATLIHDHVIVYANASDSYDYEADVDASGVASLQFWVWYDDGLSGTDFEALSSLPPPPTNIDLEVGAQAYGWHLMGFSDMRGGSGRDLYSVGFDLSHIPDQYLAFGAYAVDKEGNFSAFTQNSLRIDRTPPSTSAYVADAISLETFYVSLLGGDNMTGVHRIDIQVSINGGAWQDWLVNHFGWGGYYTGENGNTYAFRSRARDYAGHQEAYPATAEATTTVSVTTISGTVYDDMGSPLAGVSVALDLSPLRFTCTDENGQFSIKLPADGQPFSVIAGGMFQVCSYLISDYQWYNGTQDYNEAAVFYANSGDITGVDFTIGVVPDLVPPTLTYLSPMGGTWLQNNVVRVHANAYDEGYGVDYVEFWAWFDDGLGDYALSFEDDFVPPPPSRDEAVSLGAGWRVIGVDNNGDDGWSIHYNLVNIPDQKIHLYAYAYDMAENRSEGLASWDVGLDRTAPQSVMYQPDSTSTEAISIGWYSYDLVGIKSWDVQMSVDGGAWQDWIMNTTQPHTMLYGTRGTTYAFRVRATDWLGHEESWNNAPILNTTVSYTQIAGTVYQSNGITPLANIAVALDRSPLTFTCTDSNGNYQLKLPSDGQPFRVSAGGFEGICGGIGVYVPRWYGGNDNYNSGQLFTADNVDLTNIDFMIDFGVDTTPPFIYIPDLRNGTWLQHDVVTPRVIAEDYGSGINRVEFWFYYDPDITRELTLANLPPLPMTPPDADNIGALVLGWNYIGASYSNAESMDGTWSVGWDLANVADQQLIFRARAYDNVGNFADATEPNIRIDRRAPEMVMNFLESFSLQSFHVGWQGNDQGGVGIASMDIQVNINDTGWQDWINGAWYWGQTYVGTNGNTYAFRVRARDFLGHESDWSEPVSTTVSQGQFSGKVTATDGITPLANIAVMLDRSPLTFTCTNVNGDYYLPFTADAQPVRISASGEGMCGTTNYGYQWYAGTQDYNLAQALIASQGDTSDINFMLAQLSGFIAPTDLSVSLTNYNDVVLTWTDNNMDESGYVIQRSENGVTWSHLFTTSHDVETYTDTDVPCFATRHYRIATQHGSFTTDFSQNVSITTGCTPPEAPPALSLNGVVGRSSATVTVPLSLDSYVTHIILERAPQGSGDWSVVASLNVYTANQHTDNDLFCSANYAYRAKYRRTIDNIQSTYSPVLNLSTTACPIAVVNTVGLYRNGVWMFRDINDTGSADVIFNFGPQEGGWQPIVGDWNGDGVDGIGVYRNGTFILRNLSGSGVADMIFTFGQAESGWQALVGDWNGDDVDTPALYNPQTGVLKYRNSNTTGPVDRMMVFGSANGGYTIIAGDWNFNGVDNFGLYKNGVFYLSMNNQTGVLNRPFSFGPTTGDWLPIAADWDGTGIGSIGVYRDGVWRLRNSNSEGAPDLGFNFGSSGGWLPIANFRDMVGGTALMLAQGASNVTIDIVITPEIITSVPTQIAPEATDEIIITHEPTHMPTATPTAEPTMQPTLEPIATPTLEPTMTIEAVPATPSPILPPTLEPHHDDETREGE